MNRLLTLLFVFFMFNLSAQEAMRVTRSAAVDRNAPIYNIFVDADNNKWVGNDLGVFQVHTVDYAEPVKMDASQSALLRYPGGNFNLIWDTQSLYKLMSDKTEGLFEGEEDIVGAFYDPSKKELWIGTKGIGVFLFDFNGNAKLMKHMNMDNSKLRTDQITVMFSDAPGSYWIGTEEGVLHNKGSKWKLYERYVSIEAIEKSGSDVWVFGEGWLWKVNSSDKWEEVELDDSMSEGKIKDIALDSKGRMWIASEVIARFNPELGSVETFGAPEYFTSDFPSAVAVDQDDAIWVGTEDKGLYLIEKATAMSISCILDKAPSCDGQSNAELKVVVSGGAEPYTFQWTGGLKDENPKGVAPGDYEVTVTDSRGKTKTSTVTVNNPALSLEITGVQAETGAGANDGTASVTVSGGQAAYTYRWDNGETTQKAQKLNQGEHTVTVTDKEGCTSTATASINQQAAPLDVLVDQTQEVLCKASATAAVVVKVSGGKAPFTYTWSEPALQGEQAENLAAGSYLITVTDSEGTNTVTQFTIQEPDVLGGKVTMEAPATTGNKDGKASVKASGGTSPYTYKWDNGETTVTANSLGAGSRSVTITDASGCTRTVGVEVPENVLPLDAKIEQTEKLLCYAADNAALSVTVTGGKPPFTYNWNQAKVEGATPKDLGAGNYELTISDVEKTTFIVKFRIQEPEAIKINLSVESPASTGNADGKAIAKVSGGDGTYTYNWDTGENTATAIKLGPGTRSVTVTDGVGCTSTASVEISENILPLAVVIEQTNEIPCHAEKTGALATKVTGGKGPFQYAWSQADATGDALKDLAAGDYEVTVTDSAGTSFTAKTTIKAPEALSVNLRVEAPASTGNADGKASAKVSGGTGTYTYNWDTGENTATASKLGPGNHSVSVTDASGCTSTASVEITESILPLAVVIEQTNEILCHANKTAALSLKITGGKGPFEYAWNQAGATGNALKDLAAGDYEVTITDAEGTTSTTTFKIKEPAALTLTASVDAPASTDNTNGKATVKVSGGTGTYTYSWDTGESTATAIKLGPGKHTVTVTDESACTSTASVEITENILPLAVVIEQTNEILCHAEKTGALTTKVTGGKGPFQYAWSQAGATGDALKDLAAGDYEVTITDAEGTTSTTTFNVREPAVLTVIASVDAPASTDNADGKATAKASGGSSSYTYSWDTGESTATAVKLGPGNHTVTVTDESACTSTASVEITENILPLTVSVVQTKTISCHAEATAALSVTIKGGKGPYEYGWSQSDLSGDEVTNLAAGDYELTITDAQGTVAVSKLTILEPAALTATVVSNKLTSNENTTDGGAKIEIKGGVAPFEVDWDSGEKGLEAKELGVGMHKATIKDSQGCSTEVEVETKKKILPDLTLSKLRKGQRIKMEQLFFEADSFRITEVSRPVLDELYGFMIENTSVVIEVGGHTNDVPETAFCDYLSTERAKSVADYIIQKGIDPKRVFFKGYGKRKPLVSNRTAVGRAKNQRVEVKILSI